MHGCTYNYFAMFFLNYDHFMSYSTETTRFMTLCGALVGSFKSLKQTEIPLLYCTPVVSLPLGIRDGTGVQELDRLVFGDFEGDRL